MEVLELLNPLDVLELPDTYLMVEYMLSALSIELLARFIHLHVFCPTSSYSARLICLIFMVFFVTGWNLRASAALNPKR